MVIISGAESAFALAKILVTFCGTSIVVAGILFSLYQFHKNLIKDYQEKEEIARENKNLKEAGKLKRAADKRETTATRILCGTVLFCVLGLVLAIVSLLVWFKGNSW